MKTRTRNYKMFVFSAQVAQLCSLEDTTKTTETTWLTSNKHLLKTVEQYFTNMRFAEDEIVFLQMSYWSLFWV